MFVKDDHYVHPHLEFLFVCLDKEIISPGDVAFEITLIQDLDRLLVFRTGRVLLHVSDSLFELLFENVKGILHWGVGRHMDAASKIIGEFRRLKHHVIVALGFVNLYPRGRILHGETIFIALKDQEILSPTYGRQKHDYPD
jgi:hypothetical protein